MSVLRDAKELGYGLDHFMITGENFPSEWEDSHPEHSYSHHEYDDESKNVQGHIDTSSSNTNRKSYIDEYIHEYVHRYDSFNDYIADNIDEHNRYHSNGYIINHHTKKIQKTVNATGKTVTNEILDITEYIKNIDIKEARRQGIIIKSIRYQAHPLNKGDVLDSNIKKWIRDEKVLLDQIAWSVKYSEKERNEKKTIGKASHIIIEQIFSNFRIRTKTGDSCGQYYLMFGELSDNDYAKYKKHPRYNPQGTPTMMQIAFGLIKKYKELEVEIRGYIPGINESAE